MTLGEGIFWSTVLILLAAAIYQISIRKKWKLVGKVFGILIVIGAVIGGGFWGWLTYQTRPVVVTELAGLRLGMSPVEVTLLKGEPNFKGDNTKDESATEYESHYFYFGEGHGKGMLFIEFTGENQAAVKVSEICHSYRFSKLLGISMNRSETEVIRKLGKPTHESIAADGLSKYISYEQWKVAYQISEGKVNMLCVSESGKVTKTEEYVIRLDDIPE